MVLGWKPTYRSMELNREPRDKPMSIWSINLGQRRQKYTVGKRLSIQRMVLGKLTASYKIIKPGHYLIPHTELQNGVKT